MLLLMLDPGVVPAVIAAYSVVGERDQGTLEPMLTTPIRRDELLLGQGGGGVRPSVAVSYACSPSSSPCRAVRQRPPPRRSSDRPDILAQLLFTPLLAAWSIWIGMAISTRASDVRVAQQLSVLASLPTLALTTLIALGTIPATTGLALGLGAALLVANRIGWRLVSAMFDRERLITSSRG